MFKDGCFLSMLNECGVPRACPPRSQPCSCIANLLALLRQQCSKPVLDYRWHEPAKQSTCSSSSGCSPARLSLNIRTHLSPVLPLISANDEAYQYGSLCSNSQLPHSRSRRTQVKGVPGSCCRCCDHSAMKPRAGGVLWFPPFDTASPAAPPRSKTTRDAPPFPHKKNTASMPILLGTGLTTGIISR